MSFEKEYNEILPNYNKLEDEVKFIINTELLNNNIKIHSIVSRIKTFDSFQDKIKRKNIETPFQNIQDIVGIRIVVLLRSDLKTVEKLITDNFDIILKDNKIEDMDASYFGYMSNHFIVKLKNIYNGPRYDVIKDLVCEIQIRTIAMDAWATISHYLDYKTEHDVPSELKKDFYALSGLFYVSDTHFELFYKERNISKENAKKEVVANKNILINHDTLSGYLENKFPDRVNGKGKSISELIDDLYTEHYSYINELDEDIDKAFNAFIKYENKYPPGNARKFIDIGVVRTIIHILNPDKKRSSYEKEIEFKKYI